MKRATSLYWVTRPIARHHVNQSVKPSIYPSALWTAASHSIPVLYVIPNNGAYGIVAGAFGGAEANMKRTGEYRGAVLDNIDPVKLAEGFGVEGMHATDESNIADSVTALKAQLHCRLDVLV